MTTAKWRPRTEAEQIRARAAKLKNLEKAEEAKAAKFPYTKVLTEVRSACLAGHVEYETLAKVAEFREGTQRQIYVRAGDQRRRIEAWLHKTWPLDKWKCYSIKGYDAWKEYEIWVEFCGQAQSEGHRVDWDKEVAKAKKAMAPREQREAILERTGYTKIAPLPRWRQYYPRKPKDPAGP